MRGLGFIADNELFAVDVTRVQKVARNMVVMPVPTAPCEVVGIANMKGRVVTVLSLAALLGRSRDKGGGISVHGAKEINAVVFKSSTDGNDQMGLLIDKPCDLIEVDDNKILPPEQCCISGMTEVNGRLYRIINIDLISSRFKNGGGIGDEGNI